MRRILPCIQAVLPLLLFSLPAVAIAVEPYPPILCNGLFGCGRFPSNVIVTHTIPTVGGILIQLAAGGAVIAVVIAGVQMLVSYGDEGKISNARKAILYALGGLGLALSAASIVSFVSTQDYGLAGGIVGVMAAAISIIMLLFNVAFAIVIILAGMRMVTAGGNADEFKKAGNMIRWAIIGAVIVNIAKTIVQAFLALQL